MINSHYTLLVSAAWSPDLGVVTACVWLSAGIAFPTCVAVNHCIGHYSPLNSDPDTTLADGDLVKMSVLLGRAQHASGVGKVQRLNKQIASVLVI